MTSPREFDCPTCKVPCFTNCINEEGISIFPPHEARRELAQANDERYSPQLAHTDSGKVSGFKVTEQPNYGRDAQGYGMKVPTRYMIRYDNRWRRVYCILISNNGSLYLDVKGVRHFLDQDTEWELVRVRDAYDARTSVNQLIL